MTDQQEYTTSYVGHELRTLFALIMANVDILEMEHGKSEWIDDIREECKRSSFLIGKLMDAHAGEEHSRSKTDVSVQLHRMTHFFRPLAREKNLHLAEDIQDHVVSSVDRSEIVQILSVLQGNAVKYCDWDGTVSVSLHQEGEKFRLTIKNDCSTAKEQDAKRYFEKFYRSPEAQRNPNGYGLGLAIAAHIVQMHDGIITVDVDEEQKTIVFTVTM